MKIHMGALSPKFSKQLTDEGISFDKNTMNHIEADHEAACRLHCRGLVTDGEYDKILKRIMRELEQEVKK